MPAMLKSDVLCRVCSRPALIVERSWQGERAVFTYHHLVQRGRRRPPCNIIVSVKVGKKWEREETISFAKREEGENT